MTARGFEREIAAWLATVAVDDADTVAAPAAAAGSTIVPTLARPDTDARRALGALEQLARRSLVGAANLQPGDVIGEGGMGLVRLAEQVALGRTVAVKTLKPGRRDPAAALDLLREAWVTGSLEHPNIVPVHYLALDDDGRPVIVLKRIEGVAWSDLIDDADAVRDRFGATDLLAWNLGILLQVLNAVRFAHSRGVIHRDLKPSNVMVGPFGEVYLLDWGIAVSLRDDGSRRMPLAAEATTLAGTPSYMAPEMLEPVPGALTERTDVYLAGAVLHEIVTGRPPHLGDTVAAIVTSIAAGAPPLPPEAPAELARICARAMARDPADRYPTADALRRALDAYLEHRGSELVAARARERLGELIDAIAAGRARDEIYRLFGACRFGFHEALVAWRDNDGARDGLIRATMAVAEHELAAGDARAAVGLLAELDEPPAALLARARAEADAQASRRAELERVGRDHDTRIGTRTRTFMAAVLGGTFTIAPLVPVVTARADLVTHRALATWSASMLAVVGLLTLWARESLLKTAVNRAVVGSAAALFVIQLALDLAAPTLGISVASTHALHVILWATVLGMMTVAVDRRLAPAAIAYLVAFVAVTRWPEHRYYVMSASNLVFTITAVWNWRPASWRYTETERAARGKPPRPGATGGT